MSQVNTPDLIITKANEYIKMGDKENALSIINDYFNNNKKKFWSKAMESLINQYIYLSIDLSKIKYLKEALNFTRGLTQTTSIDTFKSIISKTQKTAEEKFNEAVSNLKGVQVEITDLENDDDRDETMFFGTPESKEQEELVSKEKFIWETYKSLIDFCKINDKLFDLYSSILIAAFKFCREYKRTVEFKRLSDSVRNYLQTLIRTEKRQNFQNKVQISKFSILKNLIDTRLYLIESAIDLELWMDAFKTVEDTVYLLDKVEGLKRVNEEKRQKALIQYKLKLYNSMQKLLWISGYPLYHSYANILLKKVDLFSKRKDLPIEESIINSCNLNEINEKIILAILATPLKDFYTNFDKYGEDIYNQLNDTDTETCRKMMNILKIRNLPSRKDLISNLGSLNVLNDCKNTFIKDFFECFENTVNPISLCRNGKEYLDQIINLKNPIFDKYIEKIKKNIVIKSIYIFSKKYENISFDRIKKLFTPFGYDDLQIEDILLEIGRGDYIKFKIDHMNKLIDFRVYDNNTELFNANFHNFISNGKNLVKDITNYLCPTKIKELTEKVSSKLKKLHNESFKDTKEILDLDEQETAELKSYGSKRRNAIFDLKETTLQKREAERQERIEKERAEKILLKDQQKQKELELQIKKYVIDLLRKYTNVIEVNGKKMKLDEALKDINNIREEILIQQLQTEEMEFGKVKGRKLKELSQNKDYILREYRRREIEKYEEKLKKEEEEIKKAKEEKEKKLKEEKEKKEDVSKYIEFNNKYFDSLREERMNQYKTNIEIFKDNLNQKVSVDLYNEVNTQFTKFYEEFHKMEIEQENKKKRSERWEAPRRNYSSDRYGGYGYGYGYDRYNQGVNEFKRASNYEKLVIDQPKSTDKYGSNVNEFKRGANFEKNQKETSASKDEGFQRSAKAVKKEEPKKETEKWGRGTAAQSNSPPINEFKRGSNAPKKEETKKEEPKKETEKWGRGTAAPKKEEPKKEETKKEEPKKDTGKWGRGAAAPSTPSTTEFKRGANAPKKEEPKKEEPKKETEKWGRGGGDKASTKDSGFTRGAKANEFNRGGNASTKTETENKGGRKWKK
ncbi:MAG: PCI domain-containing protein [archaeon]|nr:PCI domain-containing protein [archaeon]